jgi:glucose/arabinose dehydrogenase
MDILASSSFSASANELIFSGSTNTSSSLENHSSVKDLVFLDTSVDNYQELINEIKADEIILLKPNENGIDRISKALTSYSNLSSVHIVAHGSAGSLQLGNQRLDVDTLINYAGTIQNWSNALGADADLLFYGCNVAYGEAGANFVKQFKELTGADIAASDDLTGSASLGGDWELEVKEGEIETESVFSATAIAEYDSVFATYNGNQYQLTSSNLTWEQAQAEARRLGGNLVTINDAAEENFLKQTYGTTEGFWIGINDATIEGQFRWASGETSSYTNWAPGEPNNAGGNQDFGWMNFGASRQWDDDNPTRIRRGIIEIPGTATGSAGVFSLTNSSFSVNEGGNQLNITIQRTGGSTGTVTVGYRTTAGTATAGTDYQTASGTLTFASGETSKTVAISLLEDSVLESNETFNFILENPTGGATLASSSTAQIEIADNDTSNNGSRYVLSSANLTWEQAQAEARSLGGNLVTINNAAEENFLKQTYGTTEGFWIGINDATTEGQFRWASGETSSYTNWAPGEPNNAGGNQDFGWMNFGASRQWDDDGTTGVRRGIIEIPGGATPNAGAIGLSNNNFIVNEDSNQVIITVQRTGGSAGTVTIDYRSLGVSATNGSDYRDVRGTLTFAPGETSKSVEISILEDNNPESNETFSFTIDNPTGGAFLLAPRTAQVTIIDNDSSSNQLTYNGNQYLLTSGTLTWEEAQTEASRLGGNLVTINDVEEETWLKQTFGITQGFWIGINDRQEEGRFTWASGQVSNYTNWAAGEPNNVGEQDYGWMNYGTALKWDDTNASALFRGIIEIGGANPTPDDPNANTLVERDIISGGLAQPTAIDWTPNGQIMFVAQKDGVVRVVENGTLRSTPFIDISRIVNSSGDRGLLDIAVHPNFSTTPYVYLLFTYDPPEVQGNTGLAGPDGAGNRAGRLIRVTADASTGYTTAVANSEVILLGRNSTWNNFNGFVDSTIDFNEPPAGILPNGENVQDFLATDSETHSIGSVEFGTDGLLYVSNGDGTSYNQQDNRTLRVQDIDNLSGKILRIEPITGRGLASNPFYNGDPNSNRSKVYQYGLRNPFRFTVAPGTNRVFIGDVGWTQWEEINTGGAGANFGWPYFEGGSGENFRTVGYQDLPEAQDFYNSGQVATPSIFALNHNTGINAIILGDIYTGTAYPQQYRGDLFFNDLYTGIVRNVNFDARGNVASVETFTRNAAFVVQMTMGPDEKLYYVNLVQGRVGYWEFV